MLGFGAIGEFAIGEFRDTRLAFDILQEIITELVNEQQLTLPPSDLYHFTSLETALRIVESDSIRLSHAEYSNDQTEMERAKELIRDELNARAGDAFFAEVLSAYSAVAPSLDAYVFCMSSGRKNAAPAQDMLSQWRAYGADGRGICLTLDSAKLSRLVGNVPGLRLNPIMYEKALQVRFVGGILDRGRAAHRPPSNDAREATIAALVFATPLIKAVGFEEEQEWRLIFMPPHDGPTPSFGFQPRRDFLAPFINLEELWKDLRPRLLEIRVLKEALPNPMPRVDMPPLVPITEVMVGPSGHQSLNDRALQKLLAKANRSSVPVLRSEIPYRNLS